MLRFLTLFFLLTIALLGVLELEAIKPAVDSFCLGLANSSFWLIQLFDDQVSLSAAIIRHTPTGFALEITEVCSALSICALWLAAVLSYPATWNVKLIGLIVGLCFIQALNLIRIVSLLYVGVFFERTQFDVVHELLWPLLLHFAVIIAFITWLWLVLPTQKESHELANA